MHTKGPWSLGADLEGVITDYRDEHGNSSPDNYLRNGYVKTVCKLTHAKWAGIEEHVANGKLIAASPPVARSRAGFGERAVQHLRRGRH